MSSYRQLGRAISAALLFASLILMGCSGIRLSGDTVTALPEHVTSLGVCFSSTKFTDTQLDGRATKVGNLQIDRAYTLMRQRIYTGFKRFGVESKPGICPEDWETIPKSLDGFPFVLRLTPETSACWTGSRECRANWLGWVFRQEDGAVIWKGELKWSFYNNVTVKEQVVDEMIRQLADQLSDDDVFPQEGTPTVSKNEEGHVLKHAAAVPPASDFAVINDLDAIPNVSSRTRLMYAEWLAKPFPRAFAISAKGAWGRAYGEAAIQKAISICQQYGDPCHLYAVDDHVVWTVTK